MTDQTPTRAPLETEHVAKDRRTGRLLIGSSLYNLVLTVLCAGLLLALFQVTGTNHLLINALTQQRDQFQACKGQPATAEGCSTPVAAEPSVVVKQGSQGPVGLTGGQGPQGPQGPPGPPGVRGLPGDSPRCLLEPARCVGAAGKDGADGAAGKDGAPGAAGADGKNGLNGKDGTNGLDGAPGKDGADGAPGAMGPQGNPGRGIQKTACVNGQWVITYTDGTQEEPQGSCVAVGP